jgi:cell division protein FtsA
MKRTLVAPRNGLIAALDVGSSKICCFIARMGEDGRPRVVGIGHQLSRGMRAGAIVDMDAAEAAIRATVHAAEQMAGETIEEVVVGMSGGHPQSRTQGIEVPLTGQEVSEGDLARAIVQGRHLNGHAHDRHLVHAIPVAYCLDGIRGIRDPRGMYGERLDIQMHQVTAAATAVRNLSTCVARCHLDIAAIAVSPYASGLAVLVDDEMELGVTLIDMGGGTTTLAVFVEGQILFADSIPIGGGHVTNDIARGLSTPLAHAERMKTLYGHCLLSPSDERETIAVPQVGEDERESDSAIAKSILVGIIQPRIEETLELARAHFEASGLDKTAGRRVVLTGGASQLGGVRELAQMVLGKQVRLGRPSRLAGLAEATGGPAFAAGAGLIAYALQDSGPQPTTKLGLPTEPGGVIGRVGQWIRACF